MHGMAEEANLQNEQARVRVDSLNTEAHNLQLRETMRRSDEELNSKDRLIQKYQNEIKQRGDEIEKKVGGSKGLGGAAEAPGRISVGRAKKRNLRGGIRKRWCFCVAYSPKRK